MASEEKPTLRFTLKDADAFSLRFDWIRGQKDANEDATPNVLDRTDIYRWRLAVRRANAASGAVRGDRGRGGRRGPGVRRRRLRRARGRARRARPRGPGGRSAAAREAMAGAGRGYSNLEFDLEAGVQFSFDNNGSAIVSLEDLSQQGF